MPDRSSWLTAANLAFAALFVVAAALQYNDPDQLRWIALYGGAAAAALAARHVAGGWRAALLVAVVAAIWAAITWSDVVGHVEVTDLWRKMSEQGGAVEQYREAGGLTIVAAWLLAIGLAGRRAPP